MKTLKEREDLDLLQLTLELYSRALMFPESKQMHDNSIEARQELESRIVAYQNFIKAPVIKSVCSICNDTGWYKKKKEQTYANKCDCGK